MKLLILIAALIVFCSPPLPAVSTAAADDISAGEVRQDVEKTLDLWRDGRYEEVYSRVIAGSHTKEYFISHLASAPRRPACCWEKLQEVRVSRRDEWRATLHGKLGLDAGTGIEFMTRQLKLEKDGEVWKMTMSDVLALAGTGKKVRGGKKKRP